MVPSFSYFFRDQYQLEFYIRRLAKNRVRFVSIIQELGDDPISTTIRQIMALFDEFKHTSVAMKESARHGFCNGSLPPMGYRIVEAAEQPGHCSRIPGPAGSSVWHGKPTAALVRWASGRLLLNRRHCRDGGRWGHGVVRKVLTRTTYIGRHRLNTKVFEEARTKAPRRGGRDSVPPIVAASDFEAVQDLLKIGGPALRRCASSAVRHYPQASLRCKQTELGGYRRDHPRALAQHVEKVSIKGSKTVLLRTSSLPLHLSGA